MVHDMNLKYECKFAELIEFNTKIVSDQIELLS